MRKNTTSYVCQECGYDSPAFMGKCPECGNWNTLKEIKLVKIKESSSLLSTKTAQQLVPRTLSQISQSENQRATTGFSELDTVLGGGLVAGAVTLLAGDPGVGKSTLLLQTALNIAKKQTVLYISGEESEEQIKLRASRLLQANGKASAYDAYASLKLLSLSNVDTIISVIDSLRPSVIVIDSIQTMESENAGGLSGSVSQIRYATATFIRAAKTLSIPLILVGHVTKEGMVAGPMLLSHMVDTVLFLEGEKTSATRILRSFKNRFGPVDEVGVFTMEEEGIKEISHPEHIFVSETGKKAPGSVLAVTLEGTRSFMVEIQALAVYTKFPMPRRVASGFDTKRLELLLAVLQKHAKLPVETVDVFVNVAGGIKLTDRAIDLSVCLAIYSSLKNVQLQKIVGIAEVGLLGELRMVPFLDKRVREAKKLGFSQVLTTQTHQTLVDVLKSAQ
jgi:DNA repair protein RadA/Sms